MGHEIPLVIFQEAGTWSTSRNACVRDVLNTDTCPTQFGHKLNMLGHSVHVHTQEEDLKKGRKCVS